MMDADIMGAEGLEEREVVGLEEKEEEEVEEVLQGLPPPEEGLHARLKELGERWRQSPAYALFMYLSVFFVVIAAVLGTGILALPIELAYSGFQPFIITYVLGFLMQCMLLLYITELLQRGQVASEFDEGGAKVDLHSLAVMFIPESSLRLAFDACVIVQFTSILVSYCLAGAEAYAAVISAAIGIDISHQLLILPFWIIFTCLIIFGRRLIEVVINLLTFTKGSLLVFMVFVTAIVATEAQQDIITNWVYIGKPLLVGTVALGGAPFVLPMIYDNVPKSRRSMLAFAFAAIAGLAAVFVLNVVWCYCLLSIVPQEGPVSLLWAEENGYISTIPLIDIIRDSYPEYAWVAITVELFILLTVTVSYITMGSALRHALVGISIALQAPSTHASSRDGEESLVEGTDKEGSPEAADSANVWKARAKWLFGKKSTLFLIAFGAVYSVAQLNPSAFVQVMEIVTSIAMNLEGGVFLILMLEEARRKQQRSIYLELFKPLFVLRWVVMGYFLFAIVYDLVTLADSIGWWVASFF